MDKRNFRCSPHRGNYALRIAHYALRIAHHALHRCCVPGLALCAAMTCAAATPGAEAYLTRARQMYQLGNYVGAIDQARRYLGTEAPQLGGAGAQRARADLLLIRASLMHGDIEAAAAALDGFMRTQAGSPLMPQARELQAEICFYRNDFAGAVRLYEALPEGQLAPAGRLHYGAALTRCGYFDRARSQFASIAADPAEGPSARFYLAYLDYLTGNDREALTAFRALPPDIAQGMGADFYIAQILYRGGEYRQVLNMQTALLNAAATLEAEGQPSTAEAWRLLGESAFAISDRAAARKHLEQHVAQHPGGGVTSARYILGLMAYDDGDYAKAADWLEPVCSSDDMLGQSALLYRGQIAARRGDLTAAAMDFDRAAHMPYDANVAETALYDYAAAVVGGGRVPFGSASTLLEEFDRRYPSSKYAAAVDQYLGTGYMAEGRYDKALACLDAIKNPSREARALTQRALYELGASALTGSNPSGAEKYLRRAVQIDADGALTPDCHLWLGDALYAQKKYDSAISSYSDFLATAPRTDANRALALYNIGYAYYQKGNYKQSHTYLDKALSLRGEVALSPTLRTDATLRKADCDNYLGNVRAALQTYQAAADAPDTPGADYAALQAACMQGVTGNHAQKIADLERMMQRWPDSPWTTQALYELAQAQLAQGDIAAATATQTRLATAAPDSQMLRESKMQMATTLSDRGETDRAIALCQDVIRTWPTSRQAVVAADYLKDLYSQQGRIADFLAFIRSVPGAPAPEASEVDRLTYTSALNAIDRKPDDAAPMEKYIEQFPNGAYTADALLSVAEIYRDTRNSDKAMAALDRILSTRADSDAALSAMAMKADILAGRGPENFPQAQKLYNELLAKGGATFAPMAYEGLMQTASTADQTLYYIDRYLQLSSLSEAQRTEALRLRAVTFMNAGRYNEALQQLSSLTGDMRTAAGAEAAVLTAQCYLKLSQADKAEKLMLSLTDNGCDDQYWLARGYITLADAYIAMGQKSKARQYLQALRDNYPGTDADITTMIASRLKKL